MQDVVRVMVGMYSYRAKERSKETVGWGRVVFVRERSLKESSYRMKTGQCFEE